MLDEAAEIGDEQGIGGSIMGTAADATRGMRDSEMGRLPTRSVRDDGESSAARAGEFGPRPCRKLRQRAVIGRWYGDLDMDDLKKFMSGIVPYWQTLGLELVEVEPGRSVFTANVRPQLLQNGVLHGGVLASIADSACAVAAISRVYPASYATTINLQVAYLKPVREGRFRAEGKCLRAGKNVLFRRKPRYSMIGRRWCTARRHSCW